MIKLVIQITRFYHLTFEFNSRSSALIALALFLLNSLQDLVGLTTRRPAAAGPKERVYSALLAWGKGKC